MFLSEEISGHIYDDFLKGFCDLEEEERGVGSTAAGQGRSRAWGRTDRPLQHHGQQPMITSATLGNSLHVRSEEKAFCF